MLLCQPKMMRIKTLFDERVLLCQITTILKRLLTNAGKSQRKISVGVKKLIKTPLRSMLLRGSIGEGCFLKLYDNRRNIQNIESSIYCPFSSGFAQFMKK